MPFEIIPTPSFIKEVKALAKKYPSLRVDLTGLGNELLTNPTLGEPLGKDCYKDGWPLLVRVKVKVVVQG